VIQELRRGGVSVTGVKVPALSKRARAEVAANVVKEGRVHYPPKRWAEEVVTQCAEYPSAGVHDDLVDCVSMLLNFVRKRYDLGLFGDDETPDEDIYSSAHRADVRGGFAEPEPENPY
jgi:hypothetical protein